MSQSIDHFTGARVFACAAALLLASNRADAVQVLYAFDTDRDQIVRDWLVGDGSQDPTLYGKVNVDEDPAQAASGEKSLRFPINPGSLNALEIPGSSNLGNSFTLAVFANELTNDFSRLFSAYNGGAPAANELVFDIDPSMNVGAGFGVRAIVNGTSVVRGVNFADANYHHLALTYDNGDVRLYLNGNQLGDAAAVPGGQVTLASNLRFGEDHPPTSLTNEPFEGYADDILVYDQALSPSQIQSLIVNGAAATLGGTAPPAPPPPPPPSPKALGSHIEMFVDRYLLDSVDNVSLRLHAPEKQETTLMHNVEYDSTTSAYHVLLRDGDQVRMYYRGNVGSNEVTLLATSADGVNFTRPDLGVFSHNGSSANNIVLQGPQAHNLAPFIDTNPAATPAERYKAIGGSGSLYALSSPDGIHWSLMQDAPLAMSGAFDSLNTVMWDAEASVYRAFTRYWDGGVRAIQVSTSTDFINWSPNQPFEYDVPLEHFYTNSIVQVPGAEQLWLGFPMRFDPSRTNLPSPGQSGVTDGVFITSRDTVFWDREFSEPWVPEGLDTTRSNMVAWGIVETADDEWSMYSTERYRLSENRLVRMTMRPYGFASVSAEEDGGSFETPAITFEGDTLLLNFVTGEQGSVRVAVLDEEGQPIPGFSLADAVPLSGDRLSLRTAWTSGRTLDELDGQVVRLSIELVDADLFALQFAPASLLADLNRDGAIDIFDVARVSSSWGSMSLAGDANRDGVVDIFDVAAVSAHWSPAASNVPEPSSVLLFCCAAAALVSRRVCRWPAAVNCTF